MLWLQRTGFGVLTWCAGQQACLHRRMTTTLLCCCLGLVTPSGCAPSNSWASRGLRPLWQALLGVLNKIMPKPPVVIKGLNWHGKQVTAVGLTVAYAGFDVYNRAIKPARTVNKDVLPILTLA